MAWNSGGISPKFECIIRLFVALTLKLVCFKWVVGLRSWIFKSNYVDLKAFGRSCCHSSTLSWAKFVGGMTKAYTVPAFHVGSHALLLESPKGNYLLQKILDE